MQATLVPMAIPLEAVLAAASAATYVAVEAMMAADAAATSVRKAVAHLITSGRTAQLNIQTFEESSSRMCNVDAGIPITPVKSDIGQMPTPRTMTPASTPECFDLAAGDYDDSVAGAGNDECETRVV